MDLHRTTRANNKVTSKGIIVRGTRIILLMFTTRMIVVVIVLHFANSVELLGLAPKPYRDPRTRTTPGAALTRPRARHAVAGAGSSRTSSGSRSWQNQTHGQMAKSLRTAAGVRDVTKEPRHLVRSRGEAAVPELRTVAGGDLRCDFGFRVQV